MDAEGSQVLKFAGCLAVSARVYSQKQHHAWSELKQLEVLAASHRHGRRIRPVWVARQGFLQTPGLRQ